MIPSPLMLNIPIVSGPSHLCFHPLKFHPSVVSYDLAWPAWEICGWLGNRAAVWWFPFRHDGVPPVILILVGFSLKLKLSSCGGKPMTMEAPSYGLLAMFETISVQDL